MSVLGLYYLWRAYKLILIECCKIVLSRQDYEAGLWARSSLVSVLWGAWGWFDFLLWGFRFFYVVWQATKWPVLTSMSLGSSSLHVPPAFGHLEANRHPSGGFRGLGTSPCNTIFMVLVFGSGMGTASMSAWV